MSTWLVPWEELTPDQVRAVELNPREHRVVFGAPGSGKTIVLVHRARHLADTFGVSPERFRIFVFTNVLKDYIRSALDLLDLPEECVLGFDAWCTEFYRKHLGGRLPWDGGGRCPDFARIREEVLKKVQEVCSKSPLYEFVLVDEGQDLSPVSFEILKVIAHHVTVFMDPKQQIYDQGSEEQQVLRTFGLRHRNVSFLEAFRCSPYVFRLASCLVTDPDERKALLGQTKVAQVERLTPLLYLAGDFEDERRRLVEVLRTRQLVDERIAILLPQKRQVFGVANGLREAGLEVEVPQTRGRNGGPATLDFGSNLPKIMPYHSAKGLTFDSVFLPRLAPNSFRNFSQERIERLLFVGISRATKWVYLSAEDGRLLPAIDTLCQSSQECQLTVQRHGDGQPMPAKGASGPSGGQGRRGEEDDDWCGI